MIKKTIFAIDNFFSTFRFIGQNKLNKFYLIPGVINIILITLFYFFSTYISHNIFNFMNRFLGANPDSLLLLLLKFIIYLTIFGIYYLIYKTLILIALSPFLSYLSEKVEFIITDKEYNFSFNDNLHFIKRGITITLKSFLRELFFTGIIFILFFIPVLNIAVPILLFIVQSYYIGFSFIDYTLERHDYNLGTEVIRKNPIFFLVNGGLFTILLFIPIIGIFIAPLITVVATTRGTLILLNNEKRGEN